MKAQEAVVLEYAPVYAEEDPTEVGTSERVSLVNEVVTWSVLAICLAGWSIIGLFLWIPRVVRAVLLFSVALVQSTMAETGAEHAGRRLRSAANFYRRGFVGAVEAIRSPREETKEEAAAGLGIDGRLILRESAWALFVWYLILWAVGFPEVTPVDLVSYLTGLPWSEVWSSTFEALASIPELFRR